jgi:hypothetical protein
MSYINIFGGSPVQVSDVSYLEIALTGSITLSWPTQFQDTNNVVARIMDVTPSGGGFSITLPDATQTSVGTDFLINNISGANGFTVLNNGGGLLATFATQALFYFYLIDNTTTNGTWRVIPFGLGVGSVVTQVAAASLTAGLTITGSPITSSGTLNFSLSNQLVALNNFAGTGIMVQTGVATQSPVTITGGSNIVVTNGSGVLGNPIIALSTTPAVTSLTVGNFIIGGSTIITNGGNLPIALTPNGTGNVLMPAGSVGIPGIAFTGDTTTGFYDVSAGVIGVSASGTKIIQLSSNSGILFGAATMTVAGTFSGMVCPVSGNPSAISATTAAFYTAVTTTGSVVRTLGIYSNDVLVSNTGGGLTPDHNFPVVINGATYFVPCKASQS